MERLSVSVIIWERDTPFAEMCRSIPLAASRSDLILLVHEEVNPVCGTRAIEEAEDCLRENPSLKMVHGPEPNFCFIRGESVAELMSLFAHRPPSDLRDLIQCYRQAPDNKQCVRMLFVEFGKRLDFLPSRSAFRREQEISGHMAAILDRLPEDKRWRILEALGAAALQELRTQDKEWQLQWLVEHLEDDRLAGR